MHFWHSQLSFCLETLVGEGWNPELKGAAFWAVVIYTKQMLT